MRNIPRRTGWLSILLLTFPIASQGQVSTKASSNVSPNQSTSSNCVINAPGDGLGASTTVCYNTNTVISRGTSSPPVPITPAAPRTSAGTGYLNALQAFYSKVLPSSLPPPQAPSSIQSSWRPSSLLDPSEFAGEGEDSISKNMDDLLDHCPEAVQYVESPSGLVGQFNQAYSQSKIKSDGQASIQKIRDDLLSDTWWARSSGPDVAREVRFLADSLNDVLGMVSPEGEAVQGLKQLGNVSSRESAAYDMVNKVSEGVDKIKSAYENKDDVHKETVDVSIDLAKVAMQSTGIGQYVPFIDYAQHLQERAETEEAGSIFKAEVQAQLQKLDIQINTLRNEASDADRMINAINEIHDTVMGVCVPKSVPIGNAPKN
jgi:hypothetical protein